MSYLDALRGETLSMLRFAVINVARILLLPITLLALISTGIAEIATGDFDWGFWRSENKWAIDLLPFYGARRH